MKVARQIAELLERAGVRHVFCVPGESYLALLDELAARGGVQVVTARHESGAGFMAEAYARASGGAGVAMASRAPGALNVAIALHEAAQAGTALVALVGQVPTDRRGRGAFQEADVAAALAPVAKWTAEVGRPDRAAEAVARALAVARAGRPGPAVVALPEDVLEGESPHPAPALPEIPAPAPGLEQVRRALEWLQASRRPVAVAGRGVLRAGASRALAEFAEATHLPVFAAWRCMDAFPNDHPCYAGSPGIANDPALVAPLMEADLVLGLGTGWDEVTSLGYRAPTGKVVMVDADPDLLARVPAHLPAREWLVVQADVGLFLQQARRLAGPELGAAARRDWVRACRARFEAFSTPRPDREGRGVDPEGVVAALRQVLPPEAAIVSDAGHFASWYHRYYPFRRPGTHFAPVSGSMGYALPAAIGVALADRTGGARGPGVRPVVALAGDGGFLMTAAELATAVRLAVPVVAVVFDNALYGTIYAHHRRRSDDPRRLAVSELASPDFAALARSFGAYGEAVTETAAFEGALARALAAGGPAVLHLHLGRERLHAVTG